MESLWQTKSEKFVKVGLTQKFSVEKKSGVKCSTSFCGPLLLSLVLRPVTAQWSLRTYAVTSVRS